MGMNNQNTVPTYLQYDTCLYLLVFLCIIYKEQLLSSMKYICGYKTTKLECHGVHVHVYTQDYTTFSMLDGSAKNHGKDAAREVVNSIYTLILQACRRMGSELLYLLRINGCVGAIPT